MKIIEPTTEEMKEAAKVKLLRDLESAYDKNEELRLINLGIQNPSDPEYLEYRNKVDELLTQYRKTWQ
jgi:hypothetical protein